jgi:hypothetical protein
VGDTVPESMRPLRFPGLTSLATEPDIVGEFDGSGVGGLRRRRLAGSAPSRWEECDSDDNCASQPRMLDFDMLRDGMAVYRCQD